MYKGSCLVFKLYHGVSLFVFMLEDFMMAAKPTYAELEQKVKELEKESVKFKGGEEVLHQEKKLADGIIHSLPGLFYMFDEERFVRWNKKWETITGYSPEELGRMYGPDFFEGADREHIIDRMQEVFREGASTAEADLVTKDGRRIPYYFTGLRMVFDGKPYLIGMGIDITDRKQAEEVIKISERNYREIFNASNEAIFVHDMETGAILDVNRTMCEMFGYTCEEAVKLNVGDLSQGEPPYTIDHARQWVRKAVEEGPQRFEWLAKRKSGELFWDETNLKHAVISGQDRILAFVSDITDRKQAEEALQKSEEKYRLLADNVSDVIWVRDMNLHLTYVSPSITHQTGYTVEETMARMLEETLTPDSLKLALEVYTEELEIEKCEQKDLFRSRTIELEIKCKDGSTIWTELKMSFLRDQFGNPTGIIGVTRNITDRRQFEAQLQQTHKMEAIGTLAGGIAHDFNNILGIILGNTELALDDVPKWNPARLNLEEVRTASLRAKDVIRQLLSFARKTQLEKKPTNIIPIVKESLKLLRSSISTSIEIRQNIPKDVDTILADPTQINQVLINLCTNADHAMPDGGIIEVTIKNVELDEDTAAQHSELNPVRYVNLTVSDTGHGISQEEIDRIFDPYYTTKEVGKGTGMGLAVVHGIVKGHSGLITVESELGKGTTFSIFFPVVLKEAVVETETDEELPTGSERILFVDDEESIVKIGHQRLERLGYNVEATTSPIEALNLFISKPDQYDLVVTDLAMPKMTGDKLVKEILNIRPDIPIILCTGFSEKVNEKKAKEIGASDYIEKPLDKHDFAFKVRKVLDAE